MEGEVLSEAAIVDAHLLPDAMRGAAPPINNDSDDDVVDGGDDDVDVVAPGREAWKRRKAAEKPSWDDWVAVGRALLAGRQHVMMATKVKKPTGKTYAAAFSFWLRANELHDLDKDDRSKLIAMMLELDDIEAWRASRPEEERVRWNHPSSVWRAWKCKDRGGRWREQRAQDQEQEHDRDQEQEHDRDQGDAGDSDAAARSTSPAGDLAAPNHVRDEQERWWRDVLCIVDDAHEIAEVVDGEILPEARQALLEIIDPRSLEELGEAGQALIRLAGFLREIAEEQQEQQGEQGEQLEAPE